MVNTFAGYMVNNLNAAGDASPGAHRYVLHSPPSSSPPGAPDAPPADDISPAATRVAHAALSPVGASRLVRLPHVDQVHMRAVVKCVFLSLKTNDSWNNVPGAVLMMLSRLYICILAHCLFVFWHIDFYFIVVPQAHTFPKAAHCTLS